MEVNNENQKDTSSMITLTRCLERFAALSIFMVGDVATNSWGNIDPWHWIGPSYKFVFCAVCVSKYSQTNQDPWNESRIIPLTHE